MNACSDAGIGRDRFRLPTYAVAGLGIASAAVAGSRSPLLALGPLAILLGWSHLSSL